MPNEADVMSRNLLPFIINLICVPAALVYSSQPKLIVLAIPLKNIMSYISLSSSRANYFVLSISIKDSKQIMIIPNTTKPKI